MEIVQWVAESMHPFKIVEDRGFQCLMKTGRPDYYIPSAQTVSCDVKKIFMCCRNVTCRWHVLLDVSGVRSVANSTEMVVLSLDPEPLLTEPFGELTGVLSEIGVLRDDGAGEYPGQTR
jgi:hypothetical protein